MEQHIGKNIQALRKERGVSQGDLAAALGVTVQAVSKWETGKANPDLYLLPKLAVYFGVTIDKLFSAEEPKPETNNGITDALSLNRQSWTEVYKTDWKGTFLPRYGSYIPTEDELGLMGDVTHKRVLEIGCGGGESLLWMHEHGAKELWGLDISGEQIDKAKELLKDTGKKVELFTSPMEEDPGLPHQYFDLVYSVYGLGWSTDLAKTIELIGEYLRPGGKLVFSWDNPLMPFLDATGGRYVLARPYAREREIEMRKKGSPLRLKNWKLSDYLNSLAEHGFLLEKLVEDSVYDPAEAANFQEGKYYSAGKAEFINQVFIIKAKKM